jgi:hypothetical protein
MTNSINDNRYSRHAFGGGEHGEMLANEALVAHEATLTLGVKVRAYRRVTVEGVIVDANAEQGRSVIVEDADGLRHIVETRNLELA